MPPIRFARQQSALSYVVLLRNIRSANDKSVRARGNAGKEEGRASFVIDGVRISSEQEQQINRLGVGKVGTPVESRSSH